MAQKGTGKWVKLDSRIIHENPFYWVTEDKVIRPDGKEGQYNVVRTRGAVFIVALDNDNCVRLVRMHRYTNDKISIEIPAGGVDNDDPLTAAKRELLEETGLTAKNWKQVGFGHPANGLLDEDNFYFLATDLTQTDDNETEEEGITEILNVPLKAAFDMLKSGEIFDVQTTAALTYAALELGLIDLK